jgi:hypothetical protein
MARGLPAEMQGVFPTARDLGDQLAHADSLHQLLKLRVRRQREQSPDSRVFRAEQLCIIPCCRRSRAEHGRQPWQHTAAGREPLRSPGEAACSFTLGGGFMYPAGVGTRRRTHPGIGLELKPIQSSVFSTNFHLSSVWHQ